MHPRKLSSVPITFSVFLACCSLWFLPYGYIEVRKLFIKEFLQLFDSVLNALTTYLLFQPNKYLEKSKLKQTLLKTFLSKRVTVEYLITWRRAIVRLDAWTRQNNPNERWLLKSDITKTLQRLLAENTEAMNMFLKFSLLLPLNFRGQENLITHDYSNIPKLDAVQVRESCFNRSKFSYYM